MTQAIEIYDTTLRDGTQGEGVSFTVAAKIRVAEKLDQFGIDYIEGGWPGSNPRDMAFFEAAKRLKLKHAFGSTRRAKLAAEDDPQLQLLLEAETPVVTIFGKTWLLHVVEILRTTPEENLQMIEDSVRFLTQSGRDVIYDAEHFFDGYRDNPDYALQTLEAAKRGGAINLTLCDTNGGMLVSELRMIVGKVVKQFPDTPIGVHCHNDSGLGVAVSLAGVESGARLVQGTINGFGERNGNANLTTIIPNLSLKMDALPIWPSYAIFRSSLMRWAIECLIRRSLLLEEVPSLIKEVYMQTQQQKLSTAMNISSQSVWETARVCWYLTCPGAAV
jgi:2-isopropylmalate synthase